MYAFLAKVFSQTILYVSVCQMTDEPEFIEVNAIA